MLHQETFRVRLLERTSANVVHFGMPHSGWSRDGLLAELRRQATARGGTPSLKEFAADAGFSTHGPWRRYWPRWNDFVREAGLEVNKSFGTAPAQKAQLISEMVRAIHHFGYMPTVREVEVYRRQLGISTSGTFRRHLGARDEMVAVLLEWARSNDDATVVDACVQASASLRSNTPQPTVTVAAKPPHHPFIPPYFADLPSLSLNSDQDLLVPCRMSVSREFEIRSAAAFRTLGALSELFGQGQGRVADGLAVWPSKFALLWDTKARGSSTFRIGVEDRKFIEYCQHSREQVNRNHGQIPLVFAAIAHSFKSRDVEKAHAVVDRAHVKACSLIEVSALLALLSLHIRDGRLITTDLMMAVLGRTRIVGEDVVRDTFKQ